jgi:hypothetical protein
MSTSAADGPDVPRPRLRITVEGLLAAKDTRPITSIDDLAADTFASDQEVEEFVAFTYAERRRDLS